MSFWVPAALLLILSALWLARPLLRRGGVEPAESEQALSIYRDQIDEIDRDAKAGMISDAAAEEARREIERRALRAAASHDAGVNVTRRRTGLAAGVAGAAALAAAGVYVMFGAPSAPDQPLAARKAKAEKLLAELEPSAEEPEQAVQDPGSFEAAWSEASDAAAQGDWARAADAYRRAAALSGDAPGVVSAYAEALTLANGNKVPPVARLTFEQVLSREPKNPKARYYLALAKAQEKDFEGALLAWQLLLADSARDAPWVPIVIRDISAMARFLDADPAEALPEWALPGAQSAPAETAPADDWRAAIAAAEAQAAGGDVDGALDALDALAQRYAGAPFLRAQIESARAAIADGSKAGARRGPTREQVAEVSALSEEEQSEMIRGMVDGLAARLEDDPADLDGWLMLIRSYAVLQDLEAARSAAASASDAFPEGSDSRREVLKLAASLGVVPETATTQ